MKCSTNDIIYQETLSNESDQIQTLSYEEIANFSSSYFNNSDKSNLYSKSSKQPFIMPIMDSITQEKITNSNNFITIIPTKKTKKNVDSRILLLKFNDSIQSVVFSMVSSKTTFNGSFSGCIYISNLTGEFIDGYVVNNGYLTAKLVKKTLEEKSNLSARTTLPSDVEECPYNDKSLCELDTVTITASKGASGSIAITYIYSGYTFNNQNTSSSDNTNTYPWEYSGGSSGSNVNLSPCDYTINGCDHEVVEVPCPGDPVPNPEIAPQTSSGLDGGLHGTCTRPGKICNGTLGVRPHDGVDIKNPYGEPVYAMYDGTARLATQTNSKG